MSAAPGSSGNPERDPALEPYSLAHYWDSSDDSLLTCPFDPSHRIRRYRVERHLFHCKQNHPEVKVATCPYNAAHVLPLKVYVEHVLGCPDVRIVDAAQGVVRADWTMKPRNFRSSAALEVEDADLKKYRMLALPVVQRFLKSSPGDEAAADDPEPKGESAAPIHCRSTSATADLRETMKNNLRNDEGGTSFVEYNVIAGGVPSLVSGGGVIREAVEPADTEPMPSTPEPSGARGHVEPHSPMSMEERFAMPTAARLAKFRMRLRERPFSAENPSSGSGKTAPF